MANQIEIDKKDGRMLRPKRPLSNWDPIPLKGKQSGLSRKQTSFPDG
jgi:hypothetical protein